MKISKSLNLGVFVTLCRLEGTRSIGYMIFESVWFHDYRFVRIAEISQINIVVRT